MDMNYSNMIKLGDNTYIDPLLLQKKEREKLLKAIWGAIDVWSSTKKVKKNRERMAHLAFSILSMIDGYHKGLSPYSLDVLSEETGDRMVPLVDLSKHFYNEDPAEKIKEFFE